MVSFPIAIDLRQLVTHPLRDDYDPSRLDVPGDASLSSKKAMELRHRAALLLLVSATFGVSQDVKSDQLPTIPLTVPASVPLRLYLTKRVSKRVGAPVDARLIGPVFAFDHEVIPARTEAIGHVSRLEPVSKWERTRAILGGDFTPLHVAEVEFTSLLLPDGRQVQVQTVASAGLNSFFSTRPLKKADPNAQPAGGVVSGAKQKVRDQANAQIDRIKGIPDLVRGTDKKEWLSDYLMSRLPYHPQYVRSRTRFDAELAAPLTFGSEPVAPDSLTLLGSQPASGSVVHARLLTTLDSGISAPGLKVDAVLDQPLFSAEHKLIFPEGTRLEGSVVTVKRAGWFHHSGRLRFSFQSLELPEIAGLLAPQAAAAPAPDPQVVEEKKLRIRTEGTLAAAEGETAPVKVDSEGGVKATESKTRFIGTAVALLVARAAGDNDPLRAQSTGGTRGAVIGQKANIGGRTLGGGLGFGLLGTIAAQSSRNVGAALGYYGLAWSAFETVVARGPEVHFDKNAVVDVGLNSRTGKSESAGTTPK